MSAAGSPSAGCPTAAIPSSQAWPAVSPASQPPRSPPELPPPSTPTSPARHDRALTDTDHPTGRNGPEAIVVRDQNETVAVRIAQVLDTRSGGTLADARWIRLGQRVAVSGLAHRLRSGLALTRRTRLRSSEARRTSPG